MKKYIVFVVLISLQLLAVSQQVTKMKIGELTDYISKSQKPLVVSFWATWCGSCVEEIPYFMSTIKEKYDGEVELLLVSLDVKAYYPKKIAAFAGQRKFSAPVVWLSEINADEFCPKIDSSWTGAIPSTLMVNNKKQYRKFYEQGMTQFQFERGLKMLVE